MIRFGLNKDIVTAFVWKIDSNDESAVIKQIIRTFRLTENSGDPMVKARWRFVRDWMVVIGLWRSLLDGFRSHTRTKLSHNSFSVNTLCKVLKFWRTFVRRQSLFLIIFYFIRLRLPQQLP